MTEAEWLACADPQQLVKFLLQDGFYGGSARLAAEARVGKRKLRLFACACCRRIWHLLPDQQAREVVQVAERYADGLATREELIVASDAGMGSIPASGSMGVDRAICAAAYTGMPGGNEYREEDVCACVATAASHLGPGKTIHGHPCQLFDEAVREAEMTIQCSLCRDIFRNPFRPVAFDPVWRTATVTSLAQKVYEERRFADLPVLADALEDAGCDNRDILDHCRLPGEHVRGCWVVDLVLEKS